MIPPATRVPFSPATFHVVTGQGSDLREKIWFQSCAHLVILHRSNMSPDRHFETVPKLPVSHIMWAIGIDNEDFSSLTKMTSFVLDLYRLIDTYLFQHLEHITF